MKPYGWLKTGLPVCCPGHDKFSSDTYNNRRSKKAHTRCTKIQHHIGRLVMKKELEKEVNYLEIE